jgi:hypothetical protein
MPDKRKLKAVLTHPRVVKLISIVSALCMIATFAVNGIVGYAAYQLKWGFYDPLNPSNRFSPKIVMTSNLTSIKIAIPVYVNNTASFGYDVTGLSFDFSISNSSGVITQASSPIGSIPFGTNRLFNLTLIDADLSHLVTLGGNASLTIEITLHITYVFTTVTLAIKVTTNGGLTL